MFNTKLLTDNKANLFPLVLSVISVVFVLYHLVSAFYAQQQAVAHYTTHAFGAVLICSLSIFHGMDRGKVRRLSVFLALLGSILAIAGSAYLRARIGYLQIQAPFLAPIDVAFGIAFVVGLLIVGRFVWGAVLPIIIIIALLYLFFGPLLPYPYGHPGSDLAYNIAILGMGQTSGALKWIPLSADTLFLIMVFGGLIHRLGIYRMFMQIGRSVGNSVRGGAAIPAVTGSALIGTVTGVSMANVMITGASTIPTMKRSGYSAHTAAAIESVASSGAQILPPIMGLGIFILADFVHKPYIEVAWMGLVPALIYFIAIGAGVLLITRKNNIPHEEEAVDWREVAYLGPQLLIPLVILVYMLSQMYSGLYAGALAIIAMAVLHFITPILWRTGAKWTDLLVDLFRALAHGGIVGAQVTALVILAGMLAEVITVTNVTEIAANFIAPIYGHFPAFALIITAVFTIILGTGLPTVIAYVLGAIAMAPILQDLGFDQIATHFFIFYFAVFANITPPVALNVMVAAQIADCSFRRAVMESLRLSVPAFILPFLFLYQPTLLAFPDVSWEMAVVTLLVLTSTGSFLFGFFGFFLGHLSWGIRAAFIFVACLGIAGLIHANHIYSAIHLLSLAVMMALCRRRSSGSSGVRADPHI